MLIKIHQGYRKTVALSDKNLLDKTFTQDIRQITLHKHFFKGEEINKEKAISILQDMQKEDATFNIVGNESIQTALDAGIIKQEGIIKIDNVPVALVLL
tara:strand:- start:900 stop:1196 length:297 start_codon:yes stop_codon:yes gene_type:complete